MGLVLGGLAALGSLVSCSCVNPNADPVAQGIVDRVGASLEALRPDAPNALSDDQKFFLEFYGIEEASEHRMGTFSSGGKTLSGQVLSPASSAASRGTVVIVHGYLDHVGAVSHLANRLVREGYHVAIYDHPGHGLSEGRRVSTRDFSIYREGLADFLDVVRQFHPHPHDIVAHSMGAAVVIDYLDVHGSEGLGDIVLLTPLVRDTLPGWVHVAGKLVAPFHDYLRYNTGDEEATDDYSLFLETDPLRSRCVSFRWGVAQNRWRDSFDTTVGRSETPFVIYGDEDVLVDNDISRTWIGKVFPHHRSATVAGGGHRLLNEVPEIREEAIGLVVESLEDGA